MDAGNAKDIYSPSLEVHNTSEAVVVTLMLLTIKYNFSLTQGIVRQFVPNCFNGRRKYLCSVPWRGRAETRTSWHLNRGRTEIM